MSAVFAFILVTVFLLIVTVGGIWWLSGTGGNRPMVLEREISWIGLLDNPIDGQVDVLLLVLQIFNVVAFFAALVGICAASGNKRQFVGVICGILLLTSLGQSITWSWKFFAQLDDHEVLNHFPEETARDIEWKLRESLLTARDEPNFSTSKSLWDTLQTQRECCGVDGKSDWETGHGEYMYNSIPDSCIDHHSFHGHGYYERGCYEAIKKDLDKAYRRVWKVGSIALMALIFLQLMLTVLPAAWTMCCFEKKTKKYTMIAQCIEPPNLNSPNNAEQTPTPDFDAYIISEDPPPNDNPDAPLIIL